MSYAAKLEARARAAHAEAHLSGYRALIRDTALDLADLGAPCTRCERLAAYRTRKAATR